EDELIASEAKYRTLMDNASDAIGLCAIDGTTLEVNGQMEKLTGYTKEELIGKKFQTFLPKSVAEKAFNSFKNVIEKGSGSLFEGAIARKDGVEVPVEVTSSMVEYEGRRVVQSSIRDVTERKRAEEALIEAKQVAEKANEAKTRFVATTNHELRNPLTSMISMLKLIVSGTCESPEQEKEFLKNVYNSSVHLRGLIEHLLDLSVIESGKLKMNMRSVRIDDLLELVRQITWIQAEEKGLELTFTCDREKDNRMVYCDPDRLRELLVNLVNNAIKFTEKGSVRVTCRVPDKDNMRTLEIIDTGIGIEPDKLKEVFKPFVQAEGRQYGGGGLGLTLAKKLVLAMGGDISIESKGPGHGTKVTLTLPLAPVENKNKKKNKTG
ncbi:MAG: ATP-binding protein, partial [Nitrospinota bacterium]